MRRMEGTSGRLLLQGRGLCSRQKAKGKRLLEAELTERGCADEGERIDDGSG